ncbi:LysM peptidoglycan-binding domain-containing protein [Paenibacillus protaetiae]|uniref:LysM peptidoglycan-binding domain-containing protein n=1 Tax=Paenibacillus protaetiae TaxID=2509456 RepID=A0A4P6EQN1_9BACL|nr:LysM peptidoglycan-binding domain-containing protein [Paenibacillus protaetiae]QAY65154.1 LysM peptidoglycan-binding domain-containing protein [Paenibacillus protaetiae]
MAEQTNGLRFDVYERVHLPDDVAAIDELEEIELVPRIQVVEQGDHALLKGQLLLSGVYRSKSELAASQTLEHWIPVEISLPMNRVSRLEDISVEIDNFDVDLLSSRTINVTGVLSLRGILVESLPEAAEPWREESFTVVHRREREEAQSYPYGGYAQEWAEEQQRQPQPQQEAPQAGFSSHFGIPDEAAAIREQSEAEFQPEPRAEQPLGGQADAGWSASPWLPADAQAEERQPEAAAEAAEAGALPYEEPQPEAWTETSPVAQALEAAQPEPEKQEPRVAFGAKQEQPAKADASGVGLLTLLQTSRREQAARQAAEEELTAKREQKRNELYVDEIEWGNLFLGKQASSQNEFRKIRVCIVQKEETLESIAFRYNLNPREILLHNRLSDSSVSEGQVLYIP